ncbi:MAG: Acyl-CoA:1-acyl-sn-glycerol-3-phosphate acyltransferase [uncultured Truepera sp.]|uniref:Acyl-CoA:1-acyl-sn-glycerol-3-phosphate acyltransferase n=1 Tax=uncultured Truepera sp. TaxID=543023 RepID=A0A6J4VU92_9DEIN|nr:MAG: Acyl-CoA:1-acyl-sn-glycerol-3-phosphate acyltransferase [uncultured Truepera sp.]
MKDFRRLWFYHLASYLVRNYARLFLGLKVEGLDLIPQEGSRGLIIAGNHISTFDPPLIGSLVPREIHFMAKRELFQTQPLKWVVEHLLAFPIDRSRGDTRGIKEALRFLQSGVAIGIFPQGTRNTGDAAALDGAAFLAQRAGVALQPVAIWFEGRRLRVRFGEPFYAQDKSRAEMRTLTDTLMARISTMLPVKKETQTASDTH